MSDSLSAEELGSQMRTGSSDFLKRRRKVIGLSLFSSAVLAGIALYQTGILKNLPGPRWRGFDTQKVNGSAQAYAVLGVPDALLGLVSYAVTACLAAQGSERRLETHPLSPLLMGLKVLGDAAFAGKLTWDECSKYRAFSVWSLMIAAATWTALPLAIPEARAAVRHLTGKMHEK